MQCPNCNWQNPASYTECFSCRKPLVAASAPPLQSAPSKPAQQTKAPVTQGFGPAEPDSLNRLLATMVDGLLLVVLIALTVTVVLSVAHYLGPEFSSLGWWALGALVTLLVPFALLGWMGSSGATPGKRLFKLRIVDKAGNAPGLVSSSLRELLKYSTHLGLPFIFRFFDRLFFGDQGAHNVVAATWVVRRDSGPNNLRRFIDGQTASRARIRTLAIGVVSVLILLFGGLITIGVFQDAAEKASNPEVVEARDALREIIRTAKPVTELASAYQARTSTFAPDANTLGINKLPDGISGIRVDPRSGAIVATLATDVADGRLQGKHLAWLPEFKTGRKAGEIKKWRCGSFDIPKNELPALCRADMSVIQP